MDWADTKSINEHERKALEITEANARAHRYPRTQAEAEAELEAEIGP